MEVIKNGIFVGNKIYSEVGYDLDDDDQYGSYGVIINHDGSVTKYDFSGLEMMFNSKYIPNKKQVVKLKWHQKFINKIKSTWKKI